MSSSPSQGVPCSVDTGPGLGGHTGYESHTLARAIQAYPDGRGTLFLKVEAWRRGLGPNTPLAGVYTGPSSPSASSVASSLMEGPPGSSVARSSGTGDSSLVAISMNLELDLLGLGSGPRVAGVEK